MTVVINGTTGITNPNNMTIGNGGGSISTNTAVGASALAANTTGANSVAVGIEALRSQTTGGSNSAVGQGAMYTSTTGYYNVAMGNSAMYYTTTGYQNVAIGVGAFQSNTTSANNTVVGYQAGYTNSTGAGNVFVGAQAGYNSTGSYNTFVGTINAGSSACGGAMTTGSKNTILGGYTGNNGGLDIRTASNYIVLSDGDGNVRLTCTPGGSNQAVVSVGNNGVAAFSSGEQFNVVTGANLAAGFVNNEVGTATVYVKNLYGEGGSSTRPLINFVANSGIRGTISTNASTTTYGTTSDYRLKENVQPMTAAIEKLTLLNPVTYTWKESQTEGQGFIAHELQEVFPDAVAGDKDAVDANGDPLYQNIDQSFLVATLVKAIQELNAKVDAQAAEIAALKQA